MKIGGLQKTSLLDYPEKISAIVFTRGCNFRCGYCHNPELLDFQGQNCSWDDNSVLEFLNSRRGKLDGVVITGGEPCLQSDLKDFVLQVKQLGYLIKLDTNGCFPDVVKTLVHENLIDYIAMDIKAPLNKYALITNTSPNISNIKESINFIMQCGIDYEFRTTVLKVLLDFRDFEEIGQMVHGAKRYYLQKFVASKILRPELAEQDEQYRYTPDEFSAIIDYLRLHISFVDVR